MKNVHFAIPEIYGETLSYYELLRKLVDKTNELIENYNTVPEQISEAVANLDASQLFSTVLAQLINSIATDNTKSANAVKVYKKHDLLYATFNETVNLYESLIDFTTGKETELIVGTNIREVNISELFIELRKLTESEAIAREQADTALKTNIDNEAQAREHADTTLKTNIDNEAQAREHADQSLQQDINAEKLEREQADNTKVNKTDVLTIDQIQEQLDLNDKVVGAEGLKLKYFDLQPGTSFAYKFGRICFISCIGLIVNNLVILTLPTELRPSKKFFSMMQYRINNQYYMAILEVDTNGVVKGWSQSTETETPISNGAIYGSICYII